MMVWEINYQLDHYIIVIKTRGSISYQELPKQFEKAVVLAREVDTECFLFDDTELHINASTLDIFDLPKMILAAEIPRSGRIAVLVSPKENRKGNYHFLETLCMNQGLNVKVFFVIDEAIEWSRKLD